MMLFGRLRDSNLSRPRILKPHSVEVNENVASFISAIPRDVDHLGAFMSRLGCSIPRHSHPSVVLLLPLEVERFQYDCFTLSHFPLF